MKTIKKSLLLILLITSLTTITPLKASASIPLTYPIWGYNAQEHLCQIKIESSTSPIRENLTGDYSDIRECRYQNPEIIFYTGGGILIWLGLLLFMILFHFYLFPSLKKHKKTQQIISFQQDLIYIAIILFFTVLLFHFYSIPHAFYDYQSDIDHIIYTVFISEEFPTYISSAYITTSIFRLFFAYKKKK